MYTQFFGLHSKPFQISSDPAFMWFGEKHKEALATLRYGILDNKGFLLLTGDVGTGKTSLINSLLQSLGHDVICTTVPDPSLQKMDLFNYIAAAFGMDREFSSKGSFLGHFRKFLLQANENNKKVLLIIDEAQLLTQEMLEEIRLLSNIEKADAKLINIFFIGQNEFNEILNRPQNRAVRQRMTLNYNLDPLTPEETSAYIRHRLKVAGTKKQIFDRGAVQEIFLYSGGFPRRTNILCDHALLSGYVKEVRLITASIVRECARELKIPACVRNRDINGFANPTPSQPPTPSKSAPIQTYPAPPLPPPENRLPWTGILILISTLLLIWAFTFPDHFGTTASIIRQKASQKLAVLMGSPAAQNPDFGQPIIIPTDEPKAQATHPLEPHPDLPSNPETSQIPETIVVEKEIALQTPSKIISETQMLDSAPPPETLGRSDKSSKDVSPPPIPVIEAPLPIDTREDVHPPPPLIPPLPKDKLVVRFRYDTNDFTPKGIDELKQFTKTLILYPDVWVSIIGHTDSQGSDKYNLKLSEFRANIVKSYLMGKGINSKKMTVQGLGGNRPVEKNNTAWGRMMNRRVEIQVIDPSPPSPSQNELTPAPGQK